jgi:hypothetical protein
MLGYRDGGLSHILTSATLVSICDWAIAQFLLGKPVASYSVNGRAMTFVSIEQARALREYYTNASAA